MSARAPAADAARDGHTALLVDAGIALAESLDMAETLRRVARLTVGRLADLCVIDLLQPDGSIRLMAAAALDDRIERDLHELRERHELDPGGEHPVASVVRDGEPVLLDRVSEDAGRREVALGRAHRRFMGSSGYNSAIVAPLQARSRTLGTLSVLRVGDGAPYEEHEVEIVCELARRAALAIDNSACSPRPARSSSAWRRSSRRWPRRSRSPTGRTASCSRTAPPRSCSAPAARRS